jgi:hypothetical protein
MLLPAPTPAYHCWVARGGVLWWPPNGSVGSVRLIRFHFRSSFRILSLLDAWAIYPINLLFLVKRRMTVIY